MLTDAPGLGKTLMAANAAETPALVFCPTYLVEQWYDFLQEQFPGQSVAKAQGSRTERQAAINVWADWTICNTEMLRSYTFKHYSTIIVDEAHYLRNRNSQQAKAAFQLTKNTEYVYLLTATPIYREADDLYMLLHILDRQTFTSYYGFVREYCKAIETPWALKVVGVRNQQELKKTLSQYSLGRSYSDVAMQLPPIINNVVKLDWSLSQQAHYKEMRDFYRDNGVPLDSAGEVLQKLRQATLCPEKLTATTEIVESLLPTEKVVIFTWYRMSAELLALKFDVQAITGDMEVTLRRGFALDKDNRITIATMASLSEGIDLSHARTVIFFEEDYTPGRMYQALSRVRRASPDTTPVRAYFLQVKGTVDEVVHKAVLRRTTNAREILQGALYD